MILAQDYFEENKNNYFYYFNVPSDYKTVLIEKKSIFLIAKYNFTFLFRNPDSSSKRLKKLFRQVLKNAPSDYMYKVMYNYDGEKIKWVVTSVENWGNGAMKAEAFFNFTEMNHLPIPEIMTGNWVFNTLGENSKNGILDVNDGINDFSTKYGHKIILLKV